MMWASHMGKTIQDLNQKVRAERLKEKNRAYRMKTIFLSEQPQKKNNIFFLEFVISFVH